MKNEVLAGAVRDRCADWIEMQGYDHLARKMRLLTPAPLLVQAAMMRRPRRKSKVDPQQREARELVRVLRHLQQQEKAHMVSRGTTGRQ